MIEEKSKLHHLLFTQLFESTMRGEERPWWIGRWDGHGVALGMNLNEMTTDGNLGGKLINIQMRTLKIEVE
jgi:hypothetical protein